MPLDTIHHFNCQLLAELPHQRYEHEPILDYATDEKVKARLGWQAEFSKTLFLKFKDGRFALLLTHRDGRLDNKAVKAALGAKPSICTAEEMQAEIGCLPGRCAPSCPAPIFRYWWIRNCSTTPPSPGLRATRSRPFCWRPSIWPKCWRRSCEVSYLSAPTA